MNSWRLQNSTGRVLFKAHLTGTDTPATGKTIAVTLSKNGGAFGNPNAGASNATEIANGWYYFAPAAQDRDTLGPVVWRGTEGTIDPAETEEFVVDAVRAGLTALPNAAADAAGGLPISDAGGLDLDTLNTRVAAIPRPVWEGTLDAVADGTVEFPTGYGISTQAQIVVEITSAGAHFGKSRLATYSGAGDVWNVDKAWNADGETTPTGTPTARAFSVPAEPATNFPRVDVRAVGGTAQTAGDLAALLAALSGRIPAALVSGRMDASVGAMAANVMTASAAASDLTTELQSGLATAANLSTVAGYLDTEIAAILAIAQRLDTALELDGAVYRFTLNALELAPTGGSAPTVTQIRQEMDSNSTQLAAIRADTEDLQAQVGVDGAGLTAIGDTRLANLDATVSSRAAPGAAMTLEAGERSSIVAALFAAVTEGSETFIQTFRIMRAGLAGKSSGHAAGTPAYRDAADSKNRITAVVNANGDRTSVTTDGA